MSQPIEIAIVSSRADWDAFHALPAEIHRDHQAWVAMPDFVLRRQLDVRANPFFHRAALHPLIARIGGRVVGRICGIHDPRNPLHASGAGAHFGYFECIQGPDDERIARALFDAVAQWAVKIGATRIEGPFNPSINGESGLLVEGFDDPPMVMMPWHPPYYARLLEKSGLSPYKNLFAYRYHQGISFPEPVARQARELVTSGGVRLRTANLWRLSSELRIVAELANDSMKDHWGYVPMDEAELAEMAQGLRLALDPELLLFAEKDGRTVGFLFALPDINQVVKKAGRGPLALLKLLWMLKGPGRRRNVDRCRFITLGVLSEYRHLAIGPLLYMEMLATFNRRGFREGEASWVLEDNRTVNRVHRRLGAKQWKTWRIYAKELARA